MNPHYGEFMAKKTVTKNVHASFKIELWVGMDLGAMTLEQALEKARSMKETDVLDLSGLSFNDGNIKVDGVYES